MRAPAGAKHNVASALRTNRVYICYHTYMNKGGTAERIGPWDGGLIVPAVFCTVQRQGNFRENNESSLLGRGDFCENFFGESQT